MTNEERIDQLLSVIVAGVDMRTMQAAYFKSRTSADLIASKNAEKAFDLAAGVALRQHGQHLRGQSGSRPAA